MNKCKHCEKEITNKRNKFCNKSCSASFNNIGRVRTEESKKQVSEKIKFKFATDETIKIRMTETRTKNGNLYPTDETRQIISERTKQAYITDPSLASRQLATRIKKGILQHSEETKQKISKNRTNYLESKSNYCNWFEVFNGIENIKVQGTWEKRVAERLLSLGIKFERRSLSYKSFRKYTPDFYLPDLDIYLEVKGWWRENDKYKMLLVLEENDVTIKLLDNEKILDNFIIEDLKMFECKREDIDFSKFKNHWE